MKRLEEIREYFSVKYGFGRWQRLLYRFSNGDVQVNRFDDICKEIAEEYAKQMCDEQIQACAENASIKQESEYIDSLTGYAIVSRIDEDSILNTPNVVTICE